MTHTGLHEKNFEADIEQYLLTKGGYTKGSQATYDKEKAIDLDTLIRFVKDSQPKHGKGLNANMVIVQKHNCIKLYKETF